MRVSFFILIILLNSFGLFSQENFYYVPSIKQALALTMTAFENEDKSMLSKIALKEWNKSAYKNRIEGYISKGYAINVNFRIEECHKYFFPNGNSYNQFVMVFERNDVEGDWLPIDGYKMIGGKKKKLKTQGLVGITDVHEFRDIFDEIGDFKSAVFGIGNKSELTRFELEQKKLKATTEGFVYIKDLIVHENGTVKDVIYLKFKEGMSKTKDTHKSGWLLAGAGSMDYFYKENIYARFLNGKLDGDHLSKKNNIELDDDISAFIPKGGSGDFSNPMEEEINESPTYDEKYPELNEVVISDFSCNQREGNIYRFALAIEDNPNSETINGVINKTKIRQASPTNIQIEKLPTLDFPFLERLRAKGCNYLFTVYYNKDNTINLVLKENAEYGINKLKFLPAENAIYLDLEIIEY